jgi:NADH:ubiquinone oxidoreductase subunit E
MMINRKVYGYLTRESLAAVLDELKLTYPPSK